MSKFKEALERIREVANLLDEDDPDKVEMLNIEGDYSDLMEWTIEKRNEYMAQEQALKELIEKYTKRKKMLAQRSESMKDIMRLIMDSAGERSYKGVAGTVSKKATPPKVVILDEEWLLDNGFAKITTTVDKTFLKKCLEDGDEIEGATLSNGGETIAVRV